MLKPNYTKNTIVNLMSSILHGLGATSAYTKLGDLDKDVKKAKNIVLVVIDGLGYDSVMKLPKNSFLRSNLNQKITTVFPSTTASAITTFLTGVAPREHAITGWYMYMKEIAQVVAFLPFTTINGNDIALTQLSVPANIFERVKVEGHVVMKKSLLTSKYNAIFAQPSTAWGYNNLSGMIRNVRKAIGSSNKKKLIYAYNGGFDEFSHLYGKNAKKSKSLLIEIDAKLRLLAKRLKGTNTLLLVTADHGQIVTSKRRSIVLSNDAKLQECLSLPICGEARAAYCYVKAGFTQKFERLIKRKYGKMCSLHKSTEVKEWFGIRRENPYFTDRIGQYIILAKENYTFRYFLENEEEHYFVGHHGGLSEEEMCVPLAKVLL